MPSWMRYQVFLPLFLLQCLNLYWYYLIFQILVRYVFCVYITSSSGTILSAGLSSTRGLMINAQTMRGTVTIFKIRKRIRPIRKLAQRSTSTHDLTFLEYLHVCLIHASSTFCFHLPCSSALSLDSMPYY